MIINQYYYGVAFGDANPIALFNTLDKAERFYKEYKHVYKSLVTIKSYVIYEGRFERDGQERPQIENQY